MWLLCLAVALLGEAVASSHGAVALKLEIGDVLVAEDVDEVVGVVVPISGEHAPHDPVKVMQIQEDRSCDDSKSGNNE